MNLTEIHACMAKREDIHTLWINWPFNETVLREYGKAYNELRITTISGKNVNTVPYEVAYSRLSQLVEAIKVSVPRQTYMWDCRKGMVCSIDEYERKRV